MKAWRSITFCRSGRMASRSRSACACASTASRIHRLQLHQRTGLRRDSRPAPPAAPPRARQPGACSRCSIFMASSTPICAPAGTPSPPSTSNCTSLRRHRRLDHERSSSPAVDGLRPRRGHGCRSRRAASIRAAAASSSARCSSTKRVWTCWLANSGRSGDGVQQAPGWWRCLSMRHSSSARSERRTASAKRGAREWTISLASSVS